MSESLLQTEEIPSQRQRDITYRQGIENTEFLTLS